MPDGLSSLEWVALPGWLDLIDIAVVAAFGWLAIRYFRRTRARAALAGLALLGVVYLVARALDLRLTTSLLQAFSAVLVLVLVIVFQEDLRRVFEQLGTWRRGRASAPAGTETVNLLVRAVARMASNRTGALLVLRGREPLERHVEGGIALEGRVSEPLLLSLFDASSPGHDGAVLLRGPYVERFALHLPLSSNLAALGPGGTRHAAALGLAEACDATCIVVSEERGTVSVARNGTIRVLARLEDLLEELRALIEPEVEKRPWWRDRAALDAAAATAAALALWMVFVPGSDESELAVSAPIELTNLPRDMAVESIEPDRVEVTLRGLRRHLLLAERTGISVQIDGYLARFGRRTFNVTAQNVAAPDALEVVAVTPAQVKLSAVSPPEEPEAP